MNSQISVLIYDECATTAPLVSQASDQIELNYCSDPLSVIDLVMNDNVDVLLVSDKIETLSCVEFLDKLHAFDIINHCPIAVYSSISDKNYRTMLLDKGVVDVFEAPISVEQLLFRIKIILRQAELHKKIQLVGYKHDTQTNFYSLQQPLPDKRHFPVHDYMLVKSAVDMIKSDYIQYGTLDVLAAKLNTNERILSNAFFTIYQCSICAWIREEKLLVAKQLVLNGVGSITHIAHELCYADIAHFSRSFKHRFGCSPKKMYRKDYFF